MLCSWDAEEYGLIGSYEWVEVILLMKFSPYLENAPSLPNVFAKYLKNGLACLHQTL